MHLAEAAATDAGHASPSVPGSLSLAFSLPFCLSCPVIWQWSVVMNCSIKATLRILNTLDAQPLGIRVVQLLWRTRLLLATDNQHVTLIIRQMGLFIQASRLIERWNGRLMNQSCNTGKIWIFTTHGNSSHLQSSQRFYRVRFFIHFIHRLHWCAQLFHWGAPAHNLGAPKNTPNWNFVDIMQNNSNKRWQ